MVRDVVLPMSYSGFDEPDRDPPTNDSGELICARRCCDRTRCMASVPFPYLSCYRHERSDSILYESESDGDRGCDARRN